jgi:hypothetical protein
MEIRTCVRKTKLFHAAILLLSFLTGGIILIGCDKNEVNQKTEEVEVGQKSEHSGDKKHSGMKRGTVGANPKWFTVGSSKNLRLLIRQEIPPKALIRWQSTSGPETPSFPIASYAWYDPPRDSIIATEFIFIKEPTIKRRSAENFIPFEPGNKWTYRRRNYAYWQVRDKEPGIVKNIGVCYFWQLSKLKWGEVLDMRGRCELATERKKSSQIGDQVVKDVEFSMTIGDPVNYNDRKAFPVFLYPNNNVRDGRYRNTPPGSQTLWLKSQDSGRTEYIEIVFWEPPPSAEMEFATTERSILFDAGFSRVRNYRNGKAVFHGNIVSVESSTVSVPAGNFDGCLRNVEYLNMRRGLKGNITTLEMPSGPSVDDFAHGWITVSWYAPGVGMVREVQYTNGGRLCYEIQLVKANLR